MDRLRNTEYDIYNEDQKNNCNFNYKEYKMKFILFKRRNKLHLTKCSTVYQLKKNESFLSKMLDVH